MAKEKFDMNQYVMDQLGGSQEFAKHPKAQELTRRLQDALAFTKDLLTNPATKDGNFGSWAAGMRGRLEGKVSHIAQHEQQGMVGKIAGDIESLESALREAEQNKAEIEGQQQKGAQREKTAAAALAGEEAPVSVEKPKKEPIQMTGTGPEAAVFTPGKRAMKRWVKLLQEIPGFNQDLQAKFQRVFSMIADRNTQPSMIESTRRSWKELSAALQEVMNTRNAPPRDKEERTRIALVGLENKLDDIEALS